MSSRCTRDAVEKHLRHFATAPVEASWSTFRKAAGAREHLSKPAGVRSEGSWSSTTPVESQLEYVQKVAAARQRLSENTDVNQCPVPLITDDLGKWTVFVVRFSVSRLRALLKGRRPENRAHSLSMLKTLELNSRSAAQSAQSTGPDSRTVHALSAFWL